MQLATTRIGSALVLLATLTTACSAPSAPTRPTSPPSMSSGGAPALTDVAAERQASKRPVARHLHHHFRRAVVAAAGHSAGGHRHLSAGAPWSGRDLPRAGYRRCGGYPDLRGTDVHRREWRRAARVKCRYTCPDGTNQQQLFEHGDHHGWDRPLHECLGPVAPRGHGRSHYQHGHFHDRGWLDHLRRVGSSRTLTRGRARCVASPQVSL